jgi:hypothetical protein
MREQTERGGREFREETTGDDVSDGLMAQEHAGESAG